MKVPKCVQVTWYLTILWKKEANSNLEHWIKFEKNTDETVFILGEIQLKTRNHPKHINLIEYFPVIYSL